MEFDNTFYFMVQIDPNKREQAKSKFGGKTVSRRACTPHGDQWNEAKHMIVLQGVPQQAVYIKAKRCVCGGVGGRLSDIKVKGGQWLLSNS